MPKERSINPAAQQRKAEKQKAVAKNKKQVQAQRNEKLARRNPERLQKQIDELKELEQRGVLRPKDKENLAQLEKDVRGIRRAREALGDAAPKFPERRDQGNDVRQEQRERRQQQQQQQQQYQQNHLGKRRRGEEDAFNSGSETDPDAKSIPMPRDTPPPIPRQPREQFYDPQIGSDGQRAPHALPAKPVPAVRAQTTYSAAPQLRDLQKEATRFMPAAVAAHKTRIKGQGRLLEPEEAEKLEKAGYFAAKKAPDAGEQDSGDRHTEQQGLKEVQTQALDMDEEARKFQAELAGLIGKPPGEVHAGRRTVQIEDVKDAGD